MALHLQFAGSRGTSPTKQPAKQSEVRELLPKLKTLQDLLDFPRTRRHKARKEAASARKNQQTPKSISKSSKLATPEAPRYHAAASSSPSLLSSLRSGTSSARADRIRHHVSYTQRLRLETEFENEPNWDRKKMLELAQELGLPNRKIYKWHHNRFSKERKRVDQRTQ